MRKQALDKTDIAIIGHLQVDGRRAFTAIAKDLGISEASVRQRVARLLRTNDHPDRRRHQPAGPRPHLGADQPARGGRPP